MSTTAKVSNTITFAVVSCHHAHPRHNDKLNSRLYALGYTKLIQIECGRYTKSVSTQSTPRCITCVSISRNGPYIGGHLAFYFKLNFKQVYNVL